MKRKNVIAANKGRSFVNVEDDNNPASPPLEVEDSSLNDQICSLTESQRQITGILTSFAKSFGTMSEEVVGFRRSMMAQDQLLDNLLQYVLSQDRGSSIGEIVA